MRSSELFPFVFRWDSAPEGVADFRFLLHTPAGVYGHVRPAPDGHYYLNRQRMRFFGVNLTAGSCFPPKSEAPKIAERLARAGINCVRWHHMDSTWSQPSLIDYSKGNSLILNPEALDRMDFFFAELKKRGIYSNINLVVGRRFFSADGLPKEIDQVEDVKHQHGIGFFYAPLIELQKQFARQLLTHRNPYTGQTYAEDPAVAFVEINNENGALQSWFLGVYDAMPAVFQDDLQRQWNEWLLNKYRETARLRRAWGERSEPLGESLLQNANFERGLDAWTLEQHAGAEATAELVEGALRIQIRRAGSAGWHVQFNQAGLRVEQEKLYTVRFEARADTPREIQVSISMAHEPWRALGGTHRVTLTPEWRTYELAIVVQQADENARLLFTEMGTQQGEVWLRNLSLQPGGTLRVLPEGDVLVRKQVPLVWRRQWGGYSDTIQRDWLQFVRQMEGTYWQTLTQFLKKELGVRCIVMGTIVGCSVPSLMRELDTVDTHAYWQHPEFPNQPWSGTDWFVRNLPMVNTGAGTLSGLAVKRSAIKPFTVSEYDHPAPNQFCAEGVLMLSAYAALQDWDGIFFYTYNHRNTDLDAQRITGFFDYDQHPIKWGLLRAGAALFLRGDVRRARQLVVALLTPDQEIEALRESWGWRLTDGGDAGLDGRLAFQHRVGVATVPAQIAPSAIRPEQAKLNPKRYESDTGEVIWAGFEEQRGVVYTRTRKSKIAVGFLEGRTLNMGEGYNLKCVKAPLGGFGAFAFTIVAEKPDLKALVTVASYAENTGWGWRDLGESRVTLRDEWGRAPTLVATPTLELTLPVSTDRLQVWILDAEGRRVSQVRPKSAGKGQSVVTFSPDHRTMWYEIVIR